MIITGIADDAFNIIPLNEICQIQLKSLIRSRIRKQIQLYPIFFIFPFQAANFSTFAMIDLSFMIALAI